MTDEQGERPLYISLACGIQINLRTGEVTTPPELSLDEASHEFWRALVAAYPDIKAEMMK